MRVAAAILGIIGGIIGLFAAGAALALGGIGGVVGAKMASTVVTGGWLALALSVIGIVAGALAPPKPKLAGWLMLLAGLGGLIAVWVAFWVAGPLLLIGGILALIGSRARVTAAAVPALVLARQRASGDGDDVIVVGLDVLTARQAPLWGPSGATLGYLPAYTPAVRT